MYQLFKYIFTKIKSLIFTEVIDGKKYHAGGLLDHVEDERDYKFGLFAGLFGVSYTPLHDVLDIPTVTVKDQGVFNDCVFNAYTVQREVDLNLPLSVESIVSYAAFKGYLSGNGFSSLRNAHQAGVEWGIAEESVLPTVITNWDTFSSSKNLSPLVSGNANKHKEQSYYLCTSKDEWLKALDLGHVIHTGTTWFQNYNMSGGLKAPFILPWNTGAAVGGHSFVCRGYDMKQGLLKFQNSFGIGYGDRGCFYVKMTDWFGSGPTGYVAVEPTPVMLDAYLASIEGKQVKGDETPTIYLIKNGQKHAFPDEITFYAFGGRFDEPTRTWLTVNQGLLNQIPTGDQMDIKLSSEWPILAANWDTLKWLRAPDSFNEIDKLMQQK